MPQECIYSKTLSHWDDDGDWNPMESGKGVDHHRFNVPRGQQYARYSVDGVTATMGSGYTPLSAPSAGATGDQEIDVKWWFYPFGKIRYTLNVFAGALEPINVLFGDNNWEGRCFDAIRQGQALRIVLRGPQAKDVFRLISRQSDRPVGANLFIDPLTDTVAITIVIAAGLTTVVIFAGLAAILIFAISEGYLAHAHFKADSPVGQEEVDIDLSKP